VSCINGTPADKKDGDGFIAKLGLDGKIITLKWATGLNAPKGMGILGTNLLVTDIDRLVAIDLKTGKISNTWLVKGASLLNDLDVAPDGTVYFTDSNTSSIYALRGGTTVETVVDADTTLGGTNGIYVDGNSLMLAGTSSGDVWRFDLTTHQVQKVASEIPNGDGVEKYQKGWLVSNWNGEVHYIASDGAVTEILDSQEAKLNAADIKVIQEKHLLLVPTFFGNKVSAYELIQNK
jgi:sugar lactone lactonase YvrE